MLKICIRSGTWNLNIELKFNKNKSVRHNVYGSRHGSLKLKPGSPAIVREQGALTLAEVACHKSGRSSIQSGRVLSRCLSSFLGVSTPVRMLKRPHASPVPEKLRYLPYTSDLIKN